MINYKSLFYEDHFNKEEAKKSALNIYSKYIAITAVDSIDCPKPERLKYHAIFVDANTTNNIGKVSSASTSSFKPVYEDTFDSIEEFIANELYDEWKFFMETEDSYFNHNQIENIERSLKIRSKKIDEMIRDGLIRVVGFFQFSN